MGLRKGTAKQVKEKRSVSLRVLERVALPLVHQRPALHSYYVELALPLTRCIQLTIYIDLLELFALLIECAVDKS